MSNPDNLVDDLVRLRLELDSHTEQAAKCKGRADEATAAWKGKKDAYADLIAEAKDAYQAIADQLPAKVVKAVEGQMAAARAAHAALADIKTVARDAMPADDAPMATGVGEAFDITIGKQEN